MLRIRFLILALPFVALSAGESSAQIEKGDSQISLQGSLSTSVGQPTGSQTSGSVGGTYGYFLTRQIAIRGTAYLNVSRTSAGGGEDGSGAANDISGLYGAGVELDLTGAGQKFVPYLAFEALTLSSAQAGQSSMILGPSVGARSFVSRSTAFDVALRYQTTSDNINVGTVQTTFGFSYFFGSDRRR